MCKVGLVIGDTDHFIRPIETELRRQFHISRFTPRFVRLPLIGKRVNDLLLVKQLQQFLRQNDVVFFEWAGPLAALASHQKGHARRIVRAHRTEIFSMLNAFDWSTVDKVIFVSQAMRSHFLEKFSKYEDRTIVVYNGISLESFVPQFQSFGWRIGMLGNLNPRKRVYDVICTLADLSDNIPWQLYVGGGPVEDSLDYWDALQKLVAKLNVGDRIHFAGRVTEPWAWFQDIDIYISASYSEGHQVALIEAMASGCYCLSHCWDGVEEILPLKNIFTTGTDLQAKLLDYADQSETEKQLAQHKMRTISEERFDEQRMVQEVIDIIEEGIN